MSSYICQILQVTWGHNIVADGWAGTFNPQPHPNPPSPPHTHTHNNNISILNARFCFFYLSVMDHQTNGPADVRMYKASYRVTYPQLKMKRRKI